MRFIILLFLLIVSFQTSFAQFYSFGRNKVQYEKFDWKVLRTEHFDIYYYGEMEEIAEIGAFYAEEVYEELKIRLNHLVTRRKVPLIFYNTSLHFQQTNTTPGFIPDGVGGFFEFMKGRVVIPSTGSLNDFRHVIRHELVHVFMTNKIFRILSDRRLPADVLPPLWFVEGIAEYLSTTPDAQAEMVIRDAVLNNYFVGVKDMNAIYGTFLMYKEGQNFLEWVAETYGYEKIPLMLENFWMFSDFNDVIAYTLGKNIDLIDAEWKFYLKRKYYPMLGEKTPKEFSAHKLTNFGYNFSPVFHRDGETDYLYFVANRDGYSSLYRMEYKEGETTEPEMLLRGEKSEELEAFHLFQSGIDVSEDGTIVFVTKAGATDVLHFYSTKEDKLFRTFRAPDLVYMTSPKFSANGKKVVFSAVDQKGYSDIFVYDMDQDSLIRITNDFYDERDPVFGLSDNQILFSSDRTSGKNEKKYNIFSIAIDSRLVSHVTNLNHNSYAPIVSNDGSYLLFSSDIDGVRNIWKQEINDGSFSSGITQVTEFITSAFNPRFVNDTIIVFTGFEKFSFNLYAYNTNSAGADTTVPPPLTITMNYDSLGQSWHPGSLLSFSEREDYNYEKEYTLDYAQSQVSNDPVFGTQGGAVISLSDMLGDDNYFLIIHNTADVQSDFLKSFNIAIHRVNLSERANYGYGIFHYSGRRYDIRDSDEFFFERSFGGFYQLNFPLSKFQRLESSISIVNSDKQVIVGALERKAILVTNTLAYVTDNTLWGPTGPLDGMRGRLMLGYTSDIKFSNVNFFTVIADYRYYYRLAFTTTLALRGAFFYNEGKEARRYFMGGSWDLRGWPRWTVRGEKMWLTSMEFRFPLIDEVRVRFPFMTLGFFAFRGALFVDAGSAWDTQYRSTLGSIGGGIRMNLFGAIVLRYDIGKKIEQNFTKLQSGLFYQFFFGWDF